MSRYEISPRDEKALVESALELMISSEINPLTSEIRIAAGFHVCAPLMACERVLHRHFDAWPSPRSTYEFEWTLRR